MSDINLDSSIEVERRQRGVSSAAVPLALVMGDIVAGFLAGLIAAFFVHGWVDASPSTLFDLLLLIGCCFALGLYGRRAVSPHERLRMRIQAILLFIGINLCAALLVGGAVHALPYWLIGGALLLLVGFYVELLVVRALTQMGLWDNTLLPASPAREFGRTPSTEAAGGRLSLLLKRAIDLAIAVPAFVLLAPLVGLMAVAIKVIDPGPAFYVQSRVGRDGRRVRIFKIRSMYVDAEQRLQEHLRTNAAAQAEWLRYFKLREDPRILAYIGHFLRRSSVDELPQLWNVISGEMTLVGPRPLPDYHAASFDEEFQKIRASVTPGLTGLCQVMARRSELEMQKAHDLFYIQNRSIWLDLYILLQTVPAVLSGKSAR